MVEKSTSLHALGLEHKKKLLNCALLSQQKGQAQIDRLFEISLSETDNVNPLYMNETIKSSDQAITVTSLRTQDVLVRHLDLKLSKEKDIESVFAFQAEPMLPYSLDNAILEKIYISQSDQATTLGVISARKDYVQDHLDFWKTIQIEPEIVSCVPIALSLFSQYTIKSENPLFIVYLDEETTTCVIARQGKLLAAHSLSIGVNQIYAAFSEDRKISLEQAVQEIQEVDFQQANLEEYPLLFQSVQSLRQAIMKTYYSLSKNARGSEIKEVLVLGEVSRLNQFSQFVGMGLNKSVVYPETTNSNFSASILQKYAVSIGLALSALPSHVDQVNFRQKELSYPNPWKRYKIPVAVYLLLCFSISMALYVFGQVWQGHRQDQLKEEYGKILALMNKNYETFETEYENKHASSKMHEEGKILSLKELDHNDLMQRLSVLDKELQSTPNIFPLMPNVPHVSDVLAWLSNHPNICLKCQDENKTDDNLILIENFTYSMVKRPELNKKQEKYQVKVDVEFTASTPKLAREFHDALIAPNDFVDSKSEIKWSSNRGKYRTSFYLKDKTVYPNISGGA